MCEPTFVICISNALLIPTQVIISQRVANQAKECEIRSEIYGDSPHCPVIMDVARELFF
jgi:hypothetical protein